MNALKPFLVVEDEEFPWPMHHLEPHYSLSSQHYFMISHRLHYLMQLLHIFTSNVTDTSFTANLWSSEVKWLWVIRQNYQLPIIGQNFHIDVGLGQ